MQEYRQDLRGPDRMKKLILIPSLLAMIMALALPAFAGSADSMIRPGTPEGARVTSQLRRAAHVDLMNSQFYKDSGTTIDASTYYYRKSQEADSLARQLTEGQAVSREDVLNALNTRNAVRYGASF
jgi:hypothetical protein